MLALTGLLAGRALAHAPERPGSREIVRIQGYRGAAPAGAAVIREIVLVAQGKEHRFGATDWRRFSLEQQPPSATPKERDRVTLQADFAVLSRFANARADQLVTILGEQRPGSSDLFVLALDLCPSR